MYAPTSFNEIVDYLLRNYKLYVLTATSLLECAVTS